jgi:hypothetical protein
MITAILAAWIPTLTFEALPPQARGRVNPAYVQTLRYAQPTLSNPSLPLPPALQSAAAWRHRVRRC